MGATIKTTAGKVPGLVRARNRAAKSSVRRAVHRAAARGRGVLVRRTPVDQGQMKSSWMTKKATPSGNGMLAANINDAPHAGIVEGGARPHPVSLEGFLAIFLWAKRHGFGGARRDFQRGGRSRISGPQHMVEIYGIPFTDRDAPAAQVALAIVRKIRREGQKGTFFVKDSVPIMREIAMEEVLAELTKLSKRQLRGSK